MKVSASSSYTYILEVTLIVLSVGDGRSIVGAHESLSLFVVVKLLLREAKELCSVSTHIE